MSSEGRCLVPGKTRRDGFWDAETSLVGRTRCSSQHKACRTVHASLSLYVHTVLSSMGQFDRFSWGRGGRGRRRRNLLDPEGSECGHGDSGWGVVKVVCEGSKVATNCSIISNKSSIRHPCFICVPWVVSTQVSHTHKPPTMLVVVNLYKAHCSRLGVSRACSSILSCSSIFIKIHRPASTSDTTRYTCYPTEPTAVQSYILYPTSYILHLHTNIHTRAHTHSSTCLLLTSAVPLPSSA